MAKILFSILIMGIALIFNLLDILSFDQKFPTHPSLYGLAQFWRPFIILVRTFSFVGLGPALVISLFSKKRTFQFYLPAILTVIGVLFGVILNQLEKKYSWNAYVVPQIKIEKVGKGSIGPNEYIDVKICNNSKYPLQNLSLLVKSEDSTLNIFVPVLDEKNYDYQSFLSGECYQTKVFVPSGLTFQDIHISYGGGV